MFKKADKPEESVPSVKAARYPSYLPPPAILNALVQPGRDAKGRDTVTMPKEVFHKLLAAIAAPVFDEADYLARYADIRTLVQKGKIPSALSHFASDGHREKRATAKMPVDDDWYRATYPDVAQEIRNGKLRDGTEHFRVFGYQEARVPAKECQADVAEWTSLLKRFGKT
ncbi:hypothetical protein [Aestuariivirga sp.]|uniref:hypothetical protein n=1 Tax=Aestuariivirga sp. TaxID=2650926 RepID=UPI0039E3A499